MDIETILKHYIICALWTEELEKDFDVDDVSEETKQSMRNDIEKFVAENETALLTWEGQTTVEEQTGHDFWLTRNGHGCGFWEPEWGTVGEALTESCKKFGEAYIYIGDDGQIWN